MKPEHSHFLGPQAENSDWAKKIWNEIFDQWVDWRRKQYVSDESVFEGCRENVAQRKKTELFLNSLQERLNSEVITFSPRYMGHMISEISLPALFGHVMALLHNPNNSCAEVAKAGHQIEAEAINLLLKMVGYNVKEGRGHFTSGGTVANYEALWRARYRLDQWMAQGLALQSQGHGKDLSYFQMAHKGWDTYDTDSKKHNLLDKEIREYSLVLKGPWALNKKLSLSKMKTIDSSPIILVPSNKHYSWLKAVSLFGLGDSAFWPIDLTHEGRLCVEDLKRKIKKAQEENRMILMVVSVAGTTELGILDPIDDVQSYLDELKAKENIHIWHHIDAAYGGYFCSLSRDVNKDDKEVLSNKLLSSLEAISQSDSVTIDPHKLGYVPYSCGALLVPSHKNYTVSSFAAPYLEDHSSSVSPSWSTTIEGSRSATGASATWLSSLCLELNSQGHGQVLRNSILAKNKLESFLEESVSECLLIRPTDTNISCFTFVRKGETLSQANKRALGIHGKFKKDPNFAVSRTILTMESYSELITHNLKSRGVEIDDEQMILMRLVLMNPFYMSKDIKADYLRAVVMQIKAYLSEYHIS